MASPLDPTRVVDASVKAGEQAVEVAVGFLRLPGRFLRMVDSAEDLLARADSLMGQAERHLEHTEGLVPILKQVDRLGPDVAELLRVTYDVRRAVSGIPGMGLLLRRGRQPGPGPEDADQPTG
jgi:hypothetical protein